MPVLKPSTLRKALNAVLLGIGALLGLMLAFSAGGAPV
jgi:hypothetical protein|tara:strand:+ start:7538 stop:7651 length:114 start_codon:yes stop_codon:yes gene_type:complete